MNLAQYLVVTLGQAAPLRALVDTRVWSQVLPQNPKLPAVVLTIVSGDSDDALDGPSGVRRRRVQIDCWGESRKSADDVGRAVQATLNDHAGGAQGFEIQGVFLLTETWDFDPETKRFSVSYDFEFVTSGDEQ